MMSGDEFAQFAYDLAERRGWIKTGAQFVAERELEHAALEAAQRANQHAVRFPQTLPRSA